MWLPNGRTLATDKRIHGRRSEHIISFIFPKLVRSMRWYLSQFDIVQQGLDLVQCRGHHLHPFIIPAAHNQSRPLD